MRKNNVKIRKWNKKECGEAQKSREDSFERKRKTTTLSNISENSKKVVTVSIKFSHKKGMWIVSCRKEFKTDNWRLLQYLEGCVKGEWLSRRCPELLKAMINISAACTMHVADSQEPQQELNSMSQLSQCLTKVTALLYLGPPKFTLLFLWQNRARTKKVWRYSSALGFQGLV